MTLFGNTNKTYFMSAGTLLGEEENGTYNIKVYDADQKETIVNVRLKEYLVWEAAKGGILDEDEFFFIAKKLLVKNSNPEDVPATDTLIKRELEYVVLDLVDAELMMFRLGRPDATPDMNKTQLAMSGLFLPMIKGNETSVMTKPTAKLKMFLTANSMKANLLSENKKEILNAIDSGKTMFQYCCSIITQSKEVGEDISSLIRNGYLDCYGWGLSPKIMCGSYEKL